MAAVVVMVVVVVVVQTSRFPPLEAGEEGRRCVKEGKIKEDGAKPSGGEL